MTNHRDRTHVGHLTAMHRKKPSAPLAYLLRHGLVRGAVLDYGCGHGADVAHLRSLGYDADGWDPEWAPSGGQSHATFDTVVMVYVPYEALVDNANYAIYRVTHRR